MDFDYYQIRGKWNAATLNRRAEKLEEAQAAADELEEAGANGVEIVGVKAGKRETIRGKKKAPKAAKTPKAKKAPATKNKAAKATKKQKDKISKMSADDLRAIDSIFSHDGKIKILKTNTPKREPAGQLDLFNYQFENENKKIILSFTQTDLNSLTHAFYSLIDSGEKMPSGYKKLLDTFTESPTNGNVKIEISFKEIRVLTQVCQMYLRKYIDDKGKSSVYDTITNLKKLFIMYL